MAKGTTNELEGIIMSWSLSYEFEGKDITEESETAVKQTLVENIDTWSRETYDQIGTAMIVAVELANSGAIGDPAAKFSVVISGHANEGHKPVDGWSNDFVSVSVQQVKV